MESLASVLTRRWRRFSIWTWTCDSSRHPRAHTASSVNTNTRISRSVQSGTIATSRLTPKEVSLCPVRCITWFCNSKTLLNLNSHPHTSHLSCIHTYIPSRCCHVFTPTYQPPTIMYSHKHMLQIHWHPHTTTYYHVLTPTYQPPIMYSHLHTIQMLPCIHTHIPATYYHVLSQTYAPYNARHAHKRLCTVLPLQQNPSSPWYHQLQIDKNNKPAIDLNTLLKNEHAKGYYCILW